MSLPTKNIDTFHRAINRLLSRTNVSLTLNSRVEDPRCNRPDDPQVFTHVTNSYIFSAFNMEYAATKVWNARLKCDRSF